MRFTAKILLIILICSTSCIKHPEKSYEWIRESSNPVFRDKVEEDGYQIASDPHVFYDVNGDLKMIYTGDDDGESSIKLAEGESWTNWEASQTLLNGGSQDGLDRFKETAFYRKSNTGKHQIYYIGYSNEDQYKSQIYLAESDNLKGPYTYSESPVVSRGQLAGKEVYCMTSPSVVEHDSILHMVFIGWDASPSEVKEVWIIGCLSYDDGKTWEDFELVETPIGMEGQLTKTSEGKYLAVATQEFKGREAIYYAESDHPFGPFTYRDDPILVQSRGKLERNELIAPQIVIDNSTNQRYLFYTGAWHLRGWWIMLAEEP